MTVSWVIFFKNQPLHIKFSFIRGFHSDPDTFFIQLAMSKRISKEVSEFQIVGLTELLIEQNEQL